MSVWKPLESFSLILPRRLAPQTRVLHFLAVLASLRCAILTPITLLSTCSTRRALLQRRADLTCAAAAAAVAADAAPATLPPAHPARPPCPPARKGSSPSHWSGHRWAIFPSKVKRSQLRALLPALALAYRLPPPPADPPPARPPTRRLCRLSPARHRPRLSPPAASRRPPRQLACRPVVSPVACPPSPPLADHHASLAAALSSRLSPARPRPRPLLPPPPSPHPPAASPLARSLARSRLAFYFLVIARISPSS